MAPCSCSLWSSTPLSLAAFERVERSPAQWLRLVGIKNMELESLVELRTMLLT